MKILSYLRPIWEGKDKQPSIRRLMAIAVLIGSIRMIEHSYSTNCELNNDILLTLMGTVLILLGLITYDNLQTIKNGIQTNTNTTGSTDSSTSSNGSTN